MSRDRGSRLGTILLVSLWLHLSLLLLFVVSVRYDHPEEMLPPPATVAVLVTLDGASAATFTSMVIGG